jgi:hypothetical protein
MNPPVPMRPSRTRKAPERFRAGGGYYEYDCNPSVDAKPSSKRSRKTVVVDPLKPVGYASRLSEYHNYGKCGVREKPDSEIEMNQKIKHLSKLIREVSVYFSTLRFFN